MSTTQFGQEMSSSKGDEKVQQGSTAPSATLRTSQTQTRGPIEGWVRKLASGIILDIKARAPHYASDWTDAWNYRVVPATALIFFAKCVQNGSISL